MDNLSTTLSAVFLSSEKFPGDVLKWMKENAEPKMALKLMQVCKYFKHKKFPYTALKHLCLTDCGRWDCQLLLDKHVNSTKTLDIFDDSSLWITESFYLWQMVQPFSSVLSKICVCEAKKLVLCSQKLSFDEFKVLTSSKTILKAAFHKTSITDGSDGSDKAVALECLLPYLSHASDLYFNSEVPSFDSSIAAAAIMIPKLQSIEIFDAGIHTFNTQTFTIFMKAHPSVNCHVSFMDYRRSFPFYANFPDHLQRYLNKFLRNRWDYPANGIFFPGQDPRLLLCDDNDELYIREYEGY